MNTRANIIITDESGEELWFYRHSDGYPEGTLPSLKNFLGWVKDGKNRNNAQQASGWLIIAGAIEYETAIDFKTGPLENGISGWKIGAYEPTSGQHGDIKYLYTVHLDTLTIDVKDIYKKETYEEVL